MHASTSSSISKNRIVPPEFVLRVILGLQSPKLGQLSIIAIDRFKRLITNSIVDVCRGPATRLTTSPEGQGLIGPSLREAHQ
jgi:hypothetical protein